MNDTEVPRDAAKLNEALYNAIIGVPERGRAIQFARRGVQWFAERVLQYILQYFYTISVPCFSSLLSQYQSGNGCSGRTFILRYLFFWVWEQLPATGFAFI